MKKNRVEKLESLERVTHTHTHTSNLNRKGITLIALVVTIIVLLILAGVSILSVFGENGILNRTKIAKHETRRAQAEDILKLKILEEQTEYSGKMTLEDLLNEFNKENCVDIDVIEEIREDGILREIHVKVKGYEEFTFIIGEDFKITCEESIEGGAEITIEANPSNQVISYVEEQSVSIKAKSTKKLTTNVGKYVWTNSNVTKPTEGEWKNTITLNNGVNDFEKIGEVVRESKCKGRILFMDKNKKFGSNENRMFWTIQDAANTETIEFNRRDERHHIRKWNKRKI